MLQVVQLGPLMVEQLIPTDEQRLELLRPEPILVCLPQQPLGPADRADKVGDAPHFCRELIHVRAERLSPGAWLRVSRAGAGVVPPLWAARASPSNPRTPSTGWH